jgi:hypothetical protein
MGSKVNSLGALFNYANSYWQYTASARDDWQTERYCQGKTGVLGGGGGTVPCKSSEGFPHSRHEGMWGSGGIAPLILNLGARRWLVSFTPRLSVQLSYRKNCPDQEQDKTDALCCCCCSLHFRVRLVPTRRTHQVPSKYLLQVPHVCWYDVYWRHDGVFIFKSQPIVAQCCHCSELASLTDWQTDWIGKTAASACSVVRVSKLHIRCRFC